MVSKNKHKITKSLQDALIFCQKGQLNEARNIYQKLIKVIPTNDQMLANFGTIELQMGNVEYATELLDRSVLINPNQPNVLNNLGNYYLDNGDFQKSIKYFDRALSLGSENSNIFYNKGRAMTSINNMDGAINCYKQAIKINPENKAAHLNLGFLFNLTKNFDEAIHEYNVAIDLDENFWDAIFNRAVTFSNQGNHEKAIEDFNAAIELDPENYRAHLNLAYLELASHNYRSGWQLHESRWKVQDLESPPLATKKPKLESFEVKNKKILIWGEQGIGDHLLYSTMLPEALKTDNEFIVMLDSRLLDLYKASFKDFKNVVFLDSVGDEGLYDFHLPFASLGQFFRNLKQDFLNQKIPLLEADKEYSKTLRNRINSANKHICGISWMSKNPKIGESKSMRLEDFKSIFSLPGIDFVDLQYGDTKKEKKDLKDNFGFELIEMTDIDNFNDLGRLAALINACDFVVTTSNVTAHIAGALNKKTYLIIPETKVRVWYWGTNENSSLWYPSIKILRSDNLKDWKTPIKNLLDLLSQEIKV